MALRDWFMRRLMEAVAKHSMSPEATKAFEPPLTPTTRLTVLLDVIKLIGTGNGAGAFASLVAMYYFASSRPELQYSIKFAGVVYFVGLLVFAFGLLCFIWGLTTVETFGIQVTAAAEPKKIPDHILNRIIDGLIALATAFYVLVTSLVCFFVGTATGLYAVVRF
jgi:hypothetical protein